MEVLGFFAFLILLNSLFGGKSTGSCYDCGGEVSLQAKICPHCGRPQ
jgi:predicted amidophosphoribosyltransferase